VASALIDDERRGLAQRQVGPDWVGGVGHGAERVQTNEQRPLQLGLVVGVPAAR
jgi:hypothetical protein